MAYIGLRKPIVYPFDPVNTGKYLDGVPFGKAVSFSMSPNIAEASLYGDDILAESEKAVTSATLSLGTTDVPDKCKELMFGHKEGSEGVEHKEYTYNVDDKCFCYSICSNNNIFWKCKKCSNDIKSLRCVDCWCVYGAQSTEKCR